MFHRLCTDYPHEFCTREITKLDCFITIYSTWKPEHEQNSVKDEFDVVSNRLFEIEHGVLVDRYYKHCLRVDTVGTNRGINI